MEDFAAVLVPLGFFVLIAALFVAPRYFKSREREQLQETMRMAIDKGQNLSAETVEAIARDLKPAPSAIRDLRAAVIWTAVAAGLGFFGQTMSWISEEGDVFYVFLAMACIPGFVALAYLAMAGINYLTARKRA